MGERLERFPLRRGLELGGAHEELRPPVVAVEAREPVEPVRTSASRVGAQSRWPCALRTDGVVEYLRGGRSARRAHPPPLSPAPDAGLGEEVLWQPAEEVDKNSHSVCFYGSMAFFRFDI